MTAADLHYAAAIHHEALRHGLFPMLGERFLRQYLHSFLGSAEAVALIATIDQHPVGFLVGTVDSNAHYARAVRRHGWRMALVS